MLTMSATLLFPAAVERRVRVNLKLRLGDCMQGSITSTRASLKLPLHSFELSNKYKAIQLNLISQLVPPLKSCDEPIEHSSSMAFLPIIPHVSLRS